MGEHGAPDTRQTQLRRKRAKMCISLPITARSESKLGVLTEMGILVYRKPKGNLKKCMLEISTLTQYVQILIHLSM